MNNLIIVGNGSSLLNNERGTLIDEYDIVVRFNAFEIEQYEKYVGTKTNIWFNVINFQDKSNWRLHIPYKEIYLHSWQWDEQKDKLYISFKEYFEEHNIITPIIKTQPKTINEIAEYIGDMTYKTFSTGLIAIWETIKQYNSVSITGFDWWDITKHHYNDNAVRGSLHKPALEKAIIDKLQREKKVKFL